MRSLVTRCAIGLLALHGLVLLALLHGGMGRSLNVEEGFPAWVAASLLAGRPDLTPTRLSYTVYEAGTLYVGLLAVPPFACLGPCLLALRLVSIGLSLATVALAIVLGLRWLSPPRALAAGALLALGPPAFLLRGVQTLGDTSEVLPFLLAQWILLDHLQTTRRPKLVSAALGATTGLGLSFSYALGPGAFAVALALRAQPPRGLRLAALAAGCTAGFALPLLHAAQGVPVFEVRGRTPGALFTGPLDWLRSLGALARGAVDDFDYGEARGATPHPLVVAHRLGSLGAALGLAALERRGLLALLARLANRSAPPISPPVWLVLLYLGYLGAYLTTAVQSHYLLILLAPIEALILGELLGRACRDRWPALAVACVALGAAHLAPLAPLLSLNPARAPLYGAPAIGDHDGAWRIWGYDPHSACRGPRPLSVAEQLGAGQSLGEDGDAAGLAALTRTRPDYAAQLARGFGYGVAWRAGGDSAAVGLLIDGVPPAHRRDVLLGFGRCLGQRFPWDLAYQRASAELDDPLADALLDGYGDGLGWRLWHDPDALHALLDAMEPGEAPAVARGLARRLAAMCADPTEQDARWDRLPALLRDHRPTPSHPWGEDPPK